MSDINDIWDDEEDLAPYVRGEAPRSSVSEPPPPSSPAPADLTETAKRIATALEHVRQFLADGDNIPDDRIIYADVEVGEENDDPSPLTIGDLRALASLSASPTPTAQPAQADVECYWDAADRESGYPEISDIMESYGHGTVAEIEHVAIVKRTFHATLPAHGDDDDGWEVEALTEAEAQAALNAELARRSSAPSTSAGEA